MARAQSRFVCQACGTDFPRWEGQCRSCSAWNTLVETVMTAKVRAAAVRVRGVTTVSTSVFQAAHDRHWPSHRG